MASNTKNYFVGPADGWVLVVDATVTALKHLRISAVPHTHPFYVFSSTVTPVIGTDVGILVAHHPFVVSNYTAPSNVSKFWVRTVNSVSNSKQVDGKLQLDVYADGGVLQ